MFPTVILLSPCVYTRVFVYVPRGQRWSECWPTWWDSRSSRKDSTWVDAGLDDENWKHHFRILEFLWHFFFFLGHFNLNWASDGQINDNNFLTIPSFAWLSRRKLLKYYIKSLKQIQSELKKAAVRPFFFCPPLCGQHSVRERTKRTLLNLDQTFNEELCENKLLMWVL